jgi:hypothetical protein
MLAIRVECSKEILDGEKKVIVSGIDRKKQDKVRN